jgi:DNA-binding NarL/FixJ family response regulator
MRSSAIRLVLGEDNAIMIRGLTDLIGEFPEIDLVEVARDRDTLATAVARHEPDVLMTDLRMPPTQVDEGLQVIRRARALQPGLGVLLLSQYADPAIADALLSTGERGTGYLLKDRLGDPRELVSAIALIADGGTAIDPALVQALLQRASAEEDPLGPLTRSERDVLRLIAVGLSNEGIAGRLSIGLSAVEKHASAIFRKLPLAGDEPSNRRVRATLFYLDNAAPDAQAEVPSPV